MCLRQKWATQRQNHDSHSPLPTAMNPQFIVHSLNSFERIGNSSLVWSRTTSVLRQLYHRERSAARGTLGALRSAGGVETTRGTVGGLRGRVTGQRGFPPSPPGFAGSRGSEL